MIEHYHKFQWFYLTFLGIIFTGLAAYYFIHFGYYPVAVINSDIISAKSLNEEYAIAYQYYKKVLSEDKGVNIDGKDFRKELRRAALGDLIEQSLIENELKIRVGGELGGLVENKIKIEGANPEKLEEASRLLYGLNLAEFKEMVLIPRAEREILEGRLFLEKKDLNSWLAGARKNAKVFILTPEFYWEEGFLKSR